MRVKTLLMKRVLRSALLILLLSTFSWTNANPVNIRLAREVGAKFISANTAMRMTHANDLQLVTTYRTANNEAAFYVFNAPKGFVIVAADNCATPILGYSEEGQFDPDNVPIQMQEYLQDFVEQIQIGIAQHLEPDPRTINQWELVQVTGHLIENRSTTTVSPLLSETWDQGCYYNELCPEDAAGQCGHVWAGCVATAMGQIMHYWGYPSTGTGSHSYTHSVYGEQSANFGATTYQWANMPNYLNSSSSSTQINAVATLLWHCGVAVNMNYSPDGSGANSLLKVPPALTNYFSYSSDVHGEIRSNYSDETWINMIKACLNINRPVYYCGAGSGSHAFVCDGYNSNDLFHFNWGWNGLNNGYFALDALNPGTTHDYNSYQKAILDIHPNCEPNISNGCNLVFNLYDSFGDGWNGNALRFSSSMGCGIQQFTISDGSSATFVKEFGNGDHVVLSWNSGNWPEECSFTVSYENGNVIYEGSNPNSSFSYEFDVDCNQPAPTYYTITASASPSSGGSVSGGGTYQSGQSCTLTATAYSGYTFANWTENGVIVSTNASNTFTVTGNRTLVANFTANPVYYTISVSANPTDGGSVTGGGSYQQGQNCTLTASPNLDYNFVRWTKNGSQVSTNASYTFTVTENATYVAVFEQSNTNITHSKALTNGWNWWSTIIELNGIDGLTQLENSLGSAGQMIKSRADGYVESYQYNGTTGWFGSLTSISNEQMYKIYTDATCNASITGSLVSMSNHPITISNGWNWIGFPLNQSVSVTDALSGFSPAVNDVLKGRNGYTTYFTYNGTSDWFGSLNTLEPGCGYMYQSQSGNTKTLVFQTGRGEATVANITPENNVYQPLDQQFADNMTITAVLEVEGKELRSDNIELAAFVNGECRGSVRLLYVEPIDRYMAFLTVFGEQGEGLEFHMSDGMETLVSVDGLVYASDGVVGTISSPKVFHFGALGVGETSAMVRIYPNPVHERGELRLVLPVQSGVIEVEICNVLGMLVYRDNTHAVSASTSRLNLPATVVPGTYVLKVTAQDGTVCYGKLVVD